MNYAKIIKCDTVNGPGIRVSFYPSGCSLNCTGCFNKVAQNFNYGTMYTDSTKEEILLYCSDEHISGLSILGGHALEKENFQCIYDLCAEFKSRFPKKNIYLWTGLTLSQVKAHRYFSSILDVIDVLVDGKYDESKSRSDLYLRGSTNQNILFKTKDF